MPRTVKVEVELDPPAKTVPADVLRRRKRLKLSVAIYELADGMKLSKADLTATLAELVKDLTAV